MSTQPLPVLVYTFKQAGEILGVSECTIRRLVKDNLLHQIQVGKRPNPENPGKFYRGRPRIPRWSLERYVDQGKDSAYDDPGTPVRASNTTEVQKWPKSMKEQTRGSSGAASSRHKVTALDALLKSRISQS